MSSGRIVLAGAIAALAVASQAAADITIDLGGGWQATIFDEDNVDLEVDFVGEDFIVIQKFARFSDIDEFTGAPSAQSIAFNQTADDAETVSRIIITDEFIFNDTPFDWIGFRIALLGARAMWNPDESATYSIDPFTTMEFSDTNSHVTFGGGVVGSGDSWSPGIESGALVIDVDLSGDDPVKFVMKERPLVPAPAAIAVFAACGLLGPRRRRA